MPSRKKTLEPKIQKEGRRRTTRGRPPISLKAKNEAQTSGKTEEVQRMRVSLPSDISSLPLSSLEESFALLMESSKKGEPAPTGSSVRHDAARRTGEQVERGAIQEEVEVNVAGVENECGENDGKESEVVAAGHECRNDEKESKKMIEEGKGCRDEAVKLSPPVSLEKDKDPSLSGINVEEVEAASNSEGAVSAPSGNSPPLEIGNTPKKSRTASPPASEPEGCPVHSEVPSRRSASSRAGLRFSSGVRFQGLRISAGREGRHSENRRLENSERLSTASVMSDVTCELQSEENPPKPSNEGCDIPPACGDGFGGRRARPSNRLLSGKRINHAAVPQFLTPWAVSSPPSDPLPPTSASAWPIPSDLGFEGKEIATLRKKNEEEPYELDSQDLEDMQQMFLGLDSIIEHKQKDSDPPHIPPSKEKLQPLKAAPPIEVPLSTCLFSTAGGKAVAVDPEAMKAAARMLGEVWESSRDESWNQYKKTKQLPSPAVSSPLPNRSPPPLQTSTSLFSTAGGQDVHIDSKAIEKARRILGEGGDSSSSWEGPKEITKCETVNEKQSVISSFNSSSAFFSNDWDDDFEEMERMSEWDVSSHLPAPHSRPMLGPSSFSLFTTAGGASVSVDPAALERAARLLDF